MRNLLLFLPLFMAIFLIGCVAFIGCGSDEVELPLSALDAPTTFAMEKMAYAMENVPAAPQIVDQDYTNHNIGWPPTQIPNFGHVFVGEWSHPFIAWVRHNLEPVSGVPVEFSVNSDAVTLSSVCLTTDDEGFAEITIFSETVGNYVITAKIPNTNSKFTMLAYVREPLPDIVVSTPPPTPPIVQSSVLPPTPPQTPPTPQTEPGEPTGYVVWVEKKNQGYSSGIIHSDFVFINFDDETITFTGPDGRVDPGDTVRAYVKVEYGYTYDEASDRAPLILREMHD